LLNAIFEQDFPSCSCGSRPGRNAYQALNELDRIIFRESISHVLEPDIISCFDAIVRKHLMEMVERRISDRSILRLIEKWIHVGVLDEGRRLTSETGIGQGHVISPFLANVYLHQGALGQTWCFQRGGRISSVACACATRVCRKSMKRSSSWGCAMICWRTLAAR
jgi:retron-type reverse transcriptase